MNISELRHALLGSACIALGSIGCSAPASPGETREATGSVSAALSANARDDVTVAEVAEVAEARARDRFVSAERGRDVLAGGAPNDCATKRSPCATIQRAVDAAVAGDRVDVGAGDYVENVVVTKPLTLVGSGRRSVIRPAVSAPKPCDDSSLCGGAASTIVLVQANDVHVEKLTLDGDNCALTSGVLVGGADVDARNGIMTDYSTGVAFDGFTADDLHVRNVYFRGIYAASGGTFKIRDADVRNMSDDLQSIAIFNYGGAGVIADAVVDGAGDAIAANHSRGTVFSGNRIRNATSGVHTDNAGDIAGSSADVIEDNRVERCRDDGYGAWVFVPHVAPTVRRNRVDGCNVGLAAFGQGAAVRSAFEGNDVDGRGVAGSVGMLVTTDQLGYGAANVAVALSRNAITRTAIGLEVVETGGFRADVTAECDTFERNTTAVHSAADATRVRHAAFTRNGLAVDGRDLASGAIDAQRNWWGCAAGPGNPRCDGVAGNVDASSPLAAPARCTRGRGRAD